MTDAALLLKIAILAAGAVGRDLAPPSKSITKTAAKKTAAKAKKIVTRHPKPKPVAGPITMYDAVTVTNIPAGAQAVAGYVNGRYQTVHELEARFPRAKLLTIAVTADADADCLDVENGDATPEQAPQWVHRQLARRVKRPCIYANRSTMPAVWAALTRVGIERDEVRLWVADWTGEPHIPAPYDACQWHGGVDVAYDQSLTLAGFFA